MSLITLGLGGVSTSNEYEELRALVNLVKIQTDKIPTLATQASVDNLPQVVPTAEQNADAILHRVI
jgi:hypothetical protein